MTDQQNERQDPTLDQQSASATRVDGAHLPDEVAVTQDDAPSDEVLRATAGQDESRAAEQLQRQANELTTRLSDERQELDRRQAELNRHLSQLDSERRLARLLFRERSHELVTWQEQLDRKTQQVTQFPTTQLGGDEDLEGLQKKMHRNQQTRVRRRAILDAHQQRPERREKSLDQASRQFKAGRQRAEDALRFQQQQLAEEREATRKLVHHLLESIDRRRVALEEDAAKLDSLRGPAVSREVVQEVVAHFRSTKRESDDAQALVEEQLAESQRQLEDDRQAFKSRIADERRQLVEHKRQVGTELTKRRAALRRQRDKLQTRGRVLQRMLANLKLIHRESREVRLATEQLWVHLSEKAPPTVLTESIGRIRDKLADHFRLMSTNVARQKESIQRLGSKLRDHFHQLKQQRDELERWLMRRDEDFQQQTARLVAREQQFDRQLHRYQRAEEPW